MLFARYLNYPSFILITLAIGGLVSALWHGAVFDAPYVLENFSSGVGGALFILSLGGLGRWFSKDKK